MALAAAEIGRLLSSREFASEEELNAFLEANLTGKPLVPRPPETPAERAQALVDTAWGTPARSRRIALAKQALALDGECVDACLLLAEEANSAREARTWLVKGVEMAERRIGPDRERLEADGAMWLAMESRPYMMARSELAVACWTMGDRVPAMEHAWGLLRLNPNDNQGIRYILLHWLLNAGSLEQIDRLQSMYPDDGSASWLYDLALHAFRVDGPSRSAGAALTRARRANGHVPDFLLGRREIPEELPEYVGWGDESEAASYAHLSLATWFGTPGALDWLATTPKSAGKRAGGGTRRMQQ